jgi:hypothetical protein
VRKSPFNPEVVDFGDGIQMVNSDWIFEKFRIRSDYLARKMRMLNVKPVKIGKINFYSLRKIQAALERPYYKERHF